MTLSPITSYRNPFPSPRYVAPKPQPEFGSLSPALIAVDTVMQTLQKTRAREMILEDIMGYGILRSGMDYIRPWIYGRQAQSNNNEQKPQKIKGNFAAARERILREAASIATDCVSPGIIGYAVGKMADNKLPKGLGTSMINDDTLRFFQTLLEKSPTPQAFVNALATHLTPSNSQNLAPIAAILDRSIRRGQASTADAAISIARQLGQRQLDLPMGPHWVALDSLLDDAQRFLKSTPKTATHNAFQKQGRAIIQAALKASPWKMAAGIGGALFLTFSIPYMNVLLTRKLDNLASYPAEMGLRKPITLKDESTSHVNFSYVRRQMKEGKFLPLITSLLPLGVVLGALDTVKLSNGQLKGAFINPFKGGMKGFLQNQIRLNQFSKVFPFTSQQQIASLYAALITSRLIFSRSDIEFRERLVDSVFLGWFVWILGTPFLKRSMATMSDTKNGTMLMKKVGDVMKLRSRLEIERLLPKSPRRLKTIASHIKISAGSLAATMFVLGIIEPLVAMKWSMWQAKRSSQSQ